ncbi:MAG: hypothetical protein V4687_06835 [Bacteroidota bacterium]
MVDMFRSTIGVALNNWALQNKYLRQALPEKVLLFEIDTDSIIVFLDVLADNYKNKFIYANYTTYCKQLQEKLVEIIQRQVALYDYAEYKFQFKYPFRETLLVQDIVIIKK